MLKRFFDTELNRLKRLCKNCYRCIDAIYQKPGKCSKTFHGASKFLLAVFCSTLLFNA